MKFPTFLKKKRVLAGLVFLLLAGAGAFYGLYPFGSDTESTETDTDAPDRIFTVRRGEMILGVMLTGSVNARTKHKLAMEAPWGTKLIKVVDENKEVKKGEVVAEYETYDLILKIDDLKVSLDNKKKDLEIALDEMEILKSTNEADIRTARDAVTEGRGRIQQILASRRPARPR